ncbi:MAG: hypothetical protein ACK4L7_06595 [Flavobacteriales bacterium]
MTTRKLPLAEAVLLAALLSLIVLAASAAPGNPGQVMFTGGVRPDDRTAEDVVLMVEVADQCLYAEVHPSGRFVLWVPAGAQATVAFSKPGFLTKEIALDARHSMASKNTARANRKVGFDVILEDARKRSGRRYDGPVGTLGFNKGTGAVRARHTLKVVAAPGQE